MSSDAAATTMVAAVTHVGARHSRIAPSLHRAFQSFQRSRKPRTGSWTAQALRRGVPVARRVVVPCGNPCLECRHDLHATETKPEPDVLVAARDGLERLRDFAVPRRPA